MRFRDRIGKIVKGGVGGNRALIGIFSQQQIQESGFPFAVSPDESKFPVGINGKRHVLKDGVKATIVGEGQIGYIYA